MGGVLGGYLSPFLVKRFGVRLITSRVAGVSLAAVLMIAPDCIGLAVSPYTAIALFCVGGFAHQMISVLINTLSADVFTPEEVGTANGFVGQAGWIGGLLFSLLPAYTIRSPKEQQSCCSCPAPDPASTAPPVHRLELGRPCGCRRPRYRRDWHEP
ncbi:MAG: hypothetical protein WC729_25765 [Sphingomonas sp.]|jgi:MFS family permease|uniref:hypothetical protein n=1 Tax=Sphingomonas sp. TaxID=28214 RepID=UPI00356464A6